jgi:hypothetical protein
MALKAVADALAAAKSEQRKQAGADGDARGGLAPLLEASARVVAAEASLHARLPSELLLETMEGLGKLQFSVSCTHACADAFLEVVKAGTTLLDESSFAASAGGSGKRRKRDRPTKAAESGGSAEWSVIERAVEGLAAIAEAVDGSERCEAYVAQRLGQVAGILPPPIAKKLCSRVTAVCRSLAGLAPRGSSTASALRRRSPAARIALYRCLCAWESVATSSRASDGSQSSLDEILVASVGETRLQVAEMVSAPEAETREEQAAIALHQTSLAMVAMLTTTTADVSLRKAATGRSDVSAARIDVLGVSFGHPGTGRPANWLTIAADIASVLQGAHGCWESDTTLVKSLSDKAFAWHTALLSGTQLLSAFLAENTRASFCAPVAGPLVRSLSACAEDVLDGLKALELPARSALVRSSALMWLATACISAIERLTPLFSPSEAAPLSVPLLAVVELVGAAVEQSSRVPSVCGAHVLALSRWCDDLVPPVALFSGFQYSLPLRASRLLDGSWRRPLASVDRALPGVLAPSGLRAALESRLIAPHQLSSEPEFRQELAEHAPPVVEEGLSSPTSAAVTAVTAAAVLEEQSSSSSAIAAAPVVAVAPVDDMPLPANDSQDEDDEGFPAIV